MSKKFSKGDTVVLKSGSPLMTVHGYDEYIDPNGKSVESEEDVECVWFDGNKKKSDIFHQDILIKEEIE